MYWAKVRTIGSGGRRSVKLYTVQQKTAQFSDDCALKVHADSSRTFVNWIDISLMFNSVCQKTQNAPKSMSPRLHYQGEIITLS